MTMMMNLPLKVLLRGIGTSISFVIVLRLLYRNEYDVTFS